MWEPDFAEFSNALFEVLYWLNYLMRLNCQNDMQVCLTQNKFALMRCKIDDMNVTALSSENYQSYCLYLYYLFKACVHSHRSYECVAVCLLIVFVLVIFCVKHVQHSCAAKVFAHNCLGLFSLLACFYGLDCFW